MQSAADHYLAQRVNTASPAELTAMLYDALCTRCGTELDFPEVAIESSADAARRPHRSA